MVTPVAVAWRLRIVDGFELSRAGAPVRLPVSAQRLLTFLALQDRPQSRLHVAFTLWPGASEAHAFGSLRSALFRLQAPGYRLVIVSKDELELAPEVSVDLRERLALAERLLAGEDDGVEIELDPALLTGELLPDCYDDWVLIERARYHELRLRALEALCDRELLAGRLR
jgi:DNA-binding SARP family transcriptional activator